MSFSSFTQRFEVIYTLSPPLHSVKPVLKKVSKTESQLARIEKKEKTLASFRTQLKSTGQNKFALEEKDEASHVQLWVIYV